MRLFLHTAWLYWFIVEVFNPTLTQRNFYSFSESPTASSLAFSCRSNLVFTQGDNCQLTISPQQVLLGGDENTNWNNFQVSINDRNPFNSNTIDGTGRFAYLVREISTGNIVCQSTLLAEDKSAPVLQTRDWNLGEQTWVCYDLDSILSVAASWQKPSYKYYTGRVLFNDACNGILSNIKVSDRLVVGDCDSSFFAKIYRNFSAEDASGNRRDTNQVIVFARPDWRALKYPRDTAIHACIPESIRTPWLYPYWINVVGDTILFDREYCGLSIDRRASEWLVCRKGRKIIQTLQIMDWCTSTLVHTDTTLIKIGDLEAPVIRKPLPTLQISTQPMSCTASFPVSIEQLQRIHQITFSDCDAVLLSVKVKTLIPSSIPGDSLWSERTYPVSNGTISGLPVGKHRMIFYASDPCANSRQDSIEVRVRDRIAPLVRCDNTIRVGITNGYGRLTVGDIDEGSGDNCQLRSLLVRRVVPSSCTMTFDQNGNGRLDTADALTLENGIFYTLPAERVDFFCCDIGTKVRVELIASDLTGNISRCWQEVPVEDKTPLQCLAPRDTSIFCTDKNIAQLKLFGKASVLNDLCGDLSLIELPLIDKLNNCGVGTLIRRWQVVRNLGKANEERSSECTQTITVNAIRDYAIRFPRDTAVRCQEIPPGNKLIHQENGCNILAFSVNDVRFTATGNECYKIFRTWSVVNWCEYTDGAQPIILDRDYDGDGDRGNSAFWLMVKPDGHTYIDQDLDIENKIPNDKGYWTSSKEQALIRSRGIWEYTQIIEVYDDEAPKITLLSSRFFDARNNDCTGDVSYLFSVSENCNTQNVKISLLYDEKSDGTIDRQLRLTGTYPRFRIQDRLPIGIHKVQILAEDGCGNIGRETIEIVVRDAKAPAPICINGLVVELMPLAQPRDVDQDGDLDPAAAVVWAKDFIASKVEDCSEIVAYSIHRADYIESGRERPAPDHISVALTCDDRPSILVYVYAWDANGNYGYCETYVLVQDNRSTCPSVGKASISGSVKTFTNQAVENVKLSLSGPQITNTTTDKQGKYSFVQLKEKNDYSITPSLNTNHLAGVSTYDIVLITKHILGTTPFDSPYKYIAADVDLSGFVSTLDIIQIRKLVLRLDLEFKKCPSWRFVDAGYRFLDPNNPLREPFPTQRNINNLNSEMFGLDFVGVKMGDISGNASQSNAQASAELRSERPLLPLQISGIPMEIKADEEFEIELSLPDIADLAGAQFSLAFDPKRIELSSLEYRSAGAESFGLSDLSKGLLRFSWVNNGKTVPQLAIIKAKALRIGTSRELLQLSAQDLLPEAYGQNEKLYTLALNQDKSSEAVKANYELFPNTPNPFNQSTRIAFRLAQTGPIKLLICDLAGRVLKTITGDYSAGMHEVLLEKNELPQTGILLYTLQAGDYRQTRKMVVY